MAEDSGEIVKQLRSFYDGEYYSDVAVGVVSWHLKRLARRVLAGTEQCLLLDIACGTGDWLAAAKERGAAISGVDIASRAVALAHRRLPSGCFAEATADALPFGRDSFDVVTCLGALEHFPDKKTALSEMHRVLRQHGRLLVLVPNAGFLTRRMGLFRGTEQVAIREDVLSLDSWTGLFEEAGFVVEERWRDLHVLSWSWILRKGWLYSFPRLVQAVLLSIWPLAWQYQVYHLLTPSSAKK